MNYLLGYLGGGLWIILVAMLIGALIFFSKAYRGSKSGSIIGSTTKLDVQSEKNIPIWKSPYFWGGVVLIVIGAIFFFMMRSDR